LRRAANQARNKAQKAIVQQAKKQHLGKALTNELKSLVQGAATNALAAGVGAYGRGAYGRGSYSTNEPAKVNSLFVDY
jgi:hypothetical protein